MTKPLLLLDFDRTLFDTARFVDMLWEYLASTYHIDRGREQERAKEFYRYFGEQYDYYFFDHLASIKALPPAEELTTQLKSAFQDINFLFDDAEFVLAAMDAIITFGNAPYQQFKLSFCPELKEAECHIVQSTKGEYIEQVFGDRPTILIDDKSLQPGLPVSTVFIHLDRQQHEAVKRKEATVSISSLRYYREALA